ncbi:DUF3237 domain-containing protein [Leisingera methylohalidivorans]|uniref:Uncharacterized protein n=1 Tax=Leisingera methylohalidivorans DSM 14336 TaxID=999552 RepID=V9VWG4_9RHOB|nr:DUF3237 domain-containing protein [Leisingera methylohalidivorans]AHD02049.1 hypothetical protein METH_16385 [Leisingera methylohalidivorans DSM 14336]
MTAFSAAAPRLLPCWEAHVDIAPAQTNGPGPFGNRNVVPIIGGRFAGQIAPETDEPVVFCGVVLPGGFDLQRERADGCKELEAIYHMQTDDGITVEIRNLALLTYDAAGKLHYARCRIFAEAPAGRMNWLNERVFVGSLEVVRPQEQVLIRSFVLV